MNKKISFDELIAGKHFPDYEREAAYVLGLIEKGKLKPVRASGTNGKKPALYNEYRWIEPKKDYAELLEELRYRLSPRIQIDYYLHYPGVYEKERSFVLSLSNWFRNNEEKGAAPISMNERSFEIWGHEKFLSGQKAEGISAADVLKHCGVTADELRVYHTAEPFAYYTHIRDIPQNLLILENLDPFYGMRKHLIDGNERICGLSVGTLIYGCGKKVISMFRDFGVSSEPYMTAKDNSYYYAGDLDYEGIRIYESLAESVHGSLRIIPFTSYYRCMLKKAKRLGELPGMKEKQNKQLGDHFFSFFSQEEKELILTFLEAGVYIPQEILTGSDY